MGREKVACQRVHERETENERCVVSVCKRECE